MSEGKTVTAVAGGGLVGLFAGFTFEPEKGLALLQWLNEAIGPVGFVAILSLGVGAAVSVAGNWLMWNRLKEKDEECRTELGRQRDAWKAVVDTKDQDNKEIARTVTDLLVQVTLLAERAKVTNAPTRSR